MPGVSATVGEQIEALRRVAGDSAVALIRREPDETIMRMVSGWARALAATRARALGLDLDRFESDRRSEAVAERVRADFRGGVRAGVVATPTAFVGSEPIADRIVERLAAL